jgi:hypothetical protein
LGTIDGSLWMNCFRDQGETIFLGLTAEKFHEKISAGYNDEDSIKQIGNE